MHIIIILNTFIKILHIILKVILFEEQCSVILSPEFV